MVRHSFFIIVARTFNPSRRFVYSGDSFPFIRVITRLSALGVTTRSEPILWHARNADNYSPRIRVSQKRNSLVPALHRSRFHLADPGRYACFATRACSARMYPSRARMDRYLSTRRIPTSAPFWVSPLIIFSSSSIEKSTYSS